MTRQERGFVIGLLRRKKKQIEAVGFATDDPARSRWEEQAVEKAIFALDKPLFPLSPFV